MYGFNYTLKYYFFPAEIDARIKDAGGNFLEIAPFHR